MTRRSRGSRVLILGFAALVCSAISCGGDDPGGGNGTGATAGEAGAGGTAGEDGDAGSTSPGGADGDAGEASGNAGAGGGTQGGAGSGNGGAAGAEEGGAGGAGETISLTVSDDVTELITAEDGGTLTLGILTLVIPPGALAEDTEITIKGFEESASMFLLEPDGLVFEEPVTARFDFPPGSLEGMDETGASPLLIAETASLGDELSPIERSFIEVLEDGSYRGEVSLEHFSFVTARVRILNPSQDTRIVDAQSLNVDPAAVRLGETFTAVGTLRAHSLMMPLTFDVLVGSALREVPGITVTPRSVRAVGTMAFGQVTLSPQLPYGVNLDPPVQLVASSALFLSHDYKCARPGLGRSDFTASYEVTATTPAPGLVVDFDEQSAKIRIVPGDSDMRTLYLGGRIPVSNVDVECLDERGVLAALGIAGTEHDLLVSRIKTVLQRDCYWHSTRVSCQEPNPETAILNVLDPLLSVGPSAAARLEAEFPCGEGPVGHTFCATDGAFAEGDYVFVLATFGDEIPLDDAVHHFQHAFVFDADGITSNNYVPPSAYPDDFFQGTDKWYQLFYEPGPGFSVRVVDARISTSNTVASNARIVVAGNEFAAFIPRAELDGADPGFRVSSFRHEGDYGIDGGPWELTYYPPLDEALMPAAGGDPVVLPEN